MTLLFIFLSIWIIVFVYHSKTKKYVNNNTLTLVIGKKGSGKSTYLQKQIILHKKAGWNCYTTSKDFTQATYIPPDFIGQYYLPPHSLLVCDEVALTWDNRKFKDFKDGVRDYFTYQRHFGNKVILGSQNYCLVDKKIRELVDRLYLCRCFRCLSICKLIGKRIVLTEAKGDEPSSISEQLFFKGLLGGGVSLTWIPHWAKYFDSHSLISSLKPLPSEYVPAVLDPVETKKERPATVSPLSPFICWLQSIFYKYKKNNVDD